jgi:hypothetical protein
MNIAQQAKLLPQITQMYADSALAPNSAEAWFDLARIREISGNTLDFPLRPWRPLR